MHAGATVFKRRRPRGHGRANEDADSGGARYRMTDEGRQIVAECAA